MTKYLYLMMVAPLLTGSLMFLSGCKDPRKNDKEANVTIFRSSTTYDLVRFEDKEANVYCYTMRNKDSIFCLNKTQAPSN